MINDLDNLSNTSCK